MPEDTKSTEYTVLEKKFAFRKAEILGCIVFSAGLLQSMEPTVNSLVHAALPWKSRNFFY